MLGELGALLWRLVLIRLNLLQLSDPIFEVDSFLIGHADSSRASYTNNVTVSSGYLLDLAALLSQRLHQFGTLELLDFWEAKLAEVVLTPSVQLPCLGSQDHSKVLSYLKLESFLFDLLHPMRSGELAKSTGSPDVDLAVV